jgi:hypothetical protein
MPRVNKPGGNHIAEFRDPVTSATVIFHDPSKVNHGPRSILWCAGSRKFISLRPRG